MKNLVKNLIAALCIAGMASSIAMAEAPSFTPLNFSDSSIPTTTKTVTADTKGNLTLDPSEVIGGRNMQSAILQLENAQVEVRNQLLNYKTKYAELDGKYQTTKAERKAAQKQIRQAEKRIKNLEKAKTKIRKNFEQKINM